MGWNCYRLSLKQEKGWGDEIAEVQFQIGKSVRNVSDLD